MRILGRLGEFIVWVGFADEVRDRENRFPEGMTERTARATADADPPLTAKDDKLLANDDRFRGP